MAVPEKVPPSGSGGGGSLTGLLYTMLLKEGCSISLEEIEAHEELKAAGTDGKGEVAAGAWRRKCSEQLKRFVANAGVGDTPFFSEPTAVAAFAVPAFVSPPKTPPPPVKGRPEPPAAAPRPPSAAPRRPAGSAHTARPPSASAAPPAAAPARTDFEANLDLRYRLAFGHDFVGTGKEANFAYNPRPRPATARPAAGTADAAACTAPRAPAPQPTPKEPTPTAPPSMAYDPDAWLKGRRVGGTSVLLSNMRAHVNGSVLRLQLDTVTVCVAGVTAWLAGVSAYARTITQRRASAEAPKISRPPPSARYVPPPSAAGGFDVPGKEFYSILNATRSTGASGLKKLYHTACMRYHPDRHVRAPEAEQRRAAERFRCASRAYHVLSDPILRHAYDIECEVYTAPHAPRPGRWR